RRTGRLGLADDIDQDVLDRVNARRRCVLAVEIGANFRAAARRTLPRLPLTVRREQGHEFGVPVFVDELAVLAHQPAALVLDRLAFRSVHKMSSQGGCETMPTCR